MPTDVGLHVDSIKFVVVISNYNFSICKLYNFGWPVYKLATKGVSYTGVLSEELLFS